MSNPKKVSDFLVERLRDWGVEVIYGYSGDGINGILGALGRAGNRPRLIQCPSVPEPRVARQATITFVPSSTARGQDPDMPKP